MIDCLVYHNIFTLNLFAVRKTFYFLLKVFINLGDERHCTGALLLFS